MKNPPNKMKINVETEKGGAVSFNSKHGVWASYAVAGIVSEPPPELLYAGAKLKNGRQVQFFLNREIGLVVVDVINKKPQKRNRNFTTHNLIREPKS